MLVMDVKVQHPLIRCPIIPNIHVTEDDCSSGDYFTGTEAIHL